jgi:formylglycine-generating enzyme required for sulfatase activity
VRTVFISYSSKDRDFAERLAADLRASGAGVWFDQWEIKVGDSIAQKINDGIHDNDYLAVVLSPDSVASPWVRKELNAAMMKELNRRSVFVLPILYRDCKIPALIADKHYADFRKSYEAGFSEMLRVLAPHEEGARPRPRLPVRHPPARPRRPVNWEKVGAIAGAMALLIALGTWLVPNAADFFSGWLFETPAVTPTSSPTHTPVISAGAPVPPTDTPTPIPPTPTPVPPTETPTPSAPPGMLLVPAGEFIMGSSDSDPDAADDEKPQHTVYLDAFYIDETEVTNAQYRACVEAGACNAPADTTDYDHADYAQHPVVYVSWGDADAYCLWAGKRLPAEAEWEKAARGTDGRTYPWGEGIDCDHAQYSECGGRTVPVGSKAKGASLYGALDMAGNVWEWVADWYDSGYYSKSPT